MWGNYRKMSVNLVRLVCAGVFPWQPTLHGKIVFFLGWEAGDTYLCGNLCSFFRQIGRGQKAHPVSALLKFAFSSQ